MNKKLKWIQTFEYFQSVGISSLYDTGAAGSFGRWKNENPALELEDNVKHIYNHIDKTNPYESGSPRDAFMGIPDLNQYDWNIEPITIYPNDKKIDKAMLYPASKRDVKRYMKLYDKGLEFPPIVLLDKGKGKYYSIFDGAHRLQAAINLNVPIKAYVGNVKVKN